MSMSLLMGLILGRFFVYGQICGWKQRSGSGERGAGSGEREAGFSPLSITYHAKYFSRKACSLAPKTIIS